jgi:hypothetical protein
MIYSSVEIRFFYDNEPVEFIEWFNDNELTKSFDERTDRYLLFPSSVHVGVKFREGRFEIKSFVKDVGVLNDTIPVGAWEKWSSPDLFGEIGITDSEWLGVTKLRSLLTLIDGRPVEWRPDRNAACNAEIAIISTNGQFWWTFNLEAYGQNAFYNLEKGWQYMLEAGLSERLFLEENRMSYPEWLRRFVIEN